MKDVFNLIIFGKKALVSIFEKKIGRKTSCNEVAKIHGVVDKIVKEPNREDKVAVEDGKIQNILQRDKIERGAHFIRMVIVLYIELHEEPYPYRMKEDMPLLKEAHAEVIKLCQSKLYPDIIQYTYEDMFVSDLRLLGNTEEYKHFFEEYTSNPSSFDFRKIRDFIPVKYLPDVPMDLFT